MTRKPLAPLKSEVYYGPSDHTLFTPGEVLELEAEWSEVPTLKTELNWPPPEPLPADEDTRRVISEITIMGEEVHFQILEAITAVSSVPAALAVQLREGAIPDRDPIMSEDFYAELAKESRGE